MSRPTIHSTPSQHRCWPAVALALASLGAAASRAEASPIRNHIHSQSVLKARGLGAWASYLAGGPALWATAHSPNVTPGVRAAINQALATRNPSNIWVDYLIHRRDRDPARFDRWHPRI